MKRLFAPLIGIAALFILIFFLQYVFPPLMSFLAWFFLTKEEINAPLSTGQAIAIDIATHAITYASVGAIFGFLGWFNKNAMHVIYVILSEVIALALAVLLRFILDYYWILFIILGVLLVAGITMFVLLKKREKQEEATHD